MKCLVSLVLFRMAPSASRAVLDLRQSCSAKSFSVGQFSPFFSIPLGMSVSDISTVLKFS